MHPALRRHFNAAYTPEKYRAFLARMEKRCRTPLHFRVCETPCFFPQSLLNEMAAAGQELVAQLLESRAYRAASDATIPAGFRAQRETHNPLFVSVDFGLVRDADGRVHPKLVELQAFPTLYAYQPSLAEEYRESYGLGNEPRTFFPGIDWSKYREMLRRVLLGKHAPENVVLLEIAPLEQKTLPDFLCTEDLTGIRAVDLADVVKQGRKLFYKRAGKLVPIERIYNRVIVDELLRKDLRPPFDYSDDLEVEWAGHPNWYYRISKFSIPHLKHPCVPQTWFLDQVSGLPLDRENLLLKPLYSFAGAGIVFAPTDAQLAAIPAGERHNYILQERMSFAPLIETPFGGTQAEVRIMYIWPEHESATSSARRDMIPVLPLVRMGRGKMMGVDHNRNLEWVGASAAFGVAD